MFSEMSQIKFVSKEYTFYSLSLSKAHAQAFTEKPLFECHKQNYLGVSGRDQFAFE